MDTRQMRFILLVTLAVMLTSPMAALATNYYVDSSVVSSGNGQSWATAWKNISNITGLYPGDSVYFSGGPSGGAGQTYTTNDWNPSGGSSAASITFAVGQDSSHNGMVTFSRAGSSNTNAFLYGNVRYVTINGNVGGSQHMTVSSNFDNLMYGYSASGHSMINLKLLYLNFNSQTRYDGDGIEMAHCIGIAPLHVDDEDSFIYGGATVDGWGRNSFHDNYLQVWRRRDGGRGWDCFKWTASSDVYNNVIISSYNASYNGVQHDDGMQTNGQYMRVYNNWFEGFISYPIYNEMMSNTAHWRIYNNVINSQVADAAQIDWGAFQAMALGADTSLTISDYIVANNTVIGYSGNLGIHFNTGHAATVGGGCYLVNNLFYDTGSTIYYNGNPTVSNNSDGGTSGRNFVNIGAYPTGDYHLTASSSAAIDHGINPAPSYLTAVYTTDRDGNTRVNPWDIGAYAYGSSSSSMGAPRNLGVAVGQ
jgi:hypothetical protein